jgi:hypothetical protein
VRERVQTVTFSVELEFRTGRRTRTYDGGLHETEAAAIDAALEHQTRASILEDGVKTILIEYDVRAKRVTGLREVPQPGDEPAATTQPTQPPTDDSPPRAPSGARSPAAPRRRRKPAGS